MAAGLYGEVTAQIVAAIEAGAQSGEMPWHRQGSLGSPVNAVSGRVYRGINVLLLWLAARSSGYASGEWATYRQWAEQGAQIRKGEKSTTVVVWKPRVTADPEGGAKQPGGLFARAFRVFNAAQVDGHAPAREVLPESARIERAERFFATQAASVWHGSDAAFYDPQDDSVSMPSFGAFVSAEAFYSVFAHELVHWTGAKPRLDRDLSGRFGSGAYAMEELIAELGSAFLVGHLELSATPRPDHAGYIASWLHVLGNDPRAVFTAAARAQAAADYLIAIGGDGGRAPMRDSEHGDPA